MTSREIRDLSSELQVLYNRFHDRVRRDVECQRQGLSFLLTCTYRDERDKNRISRVPSEAFEIVAMRHCRVEPVMPEEIVNHAEAAGLRYDGEHFEKCDS